MCVSVVIYLLIFCKGITLKELRSGKGSAMKKRQVLNCVCFMWRVAKKGLFTCSSSDSVNLNLMCM